MRCCSTWLRSLLCYIKKFVIEEYAVRVLHCMYIHDCYACIPCILFVYLCIYILHVCMYVYVCTSTVCILFLGMYSCDLHVNAPGSIFCVCVLSV